ncbi:MAG: hypothetical protein ABMA64_10180 [Myxococcota bacterium]
MKDVLRRFVRGELDVPGFVQAYDTLFAPFDPEPDSLQGLDQAAVHESEVFSGFLQGTWGGANPNVPRRTDWRYGIDVEPYSWVDAEAFRAFIRETLSREGIDVGLPPSG